MRCKKNLLCCLLVIFSANNQCKSQAFTGFGIFPIQKLIKKQKYSKEIVEKGYPEICGISESDGILTCVGNFVLPLKNKSLDATRLVPFCAKLSKDNSRIIFENLPQENGQTDYIGQTNYIGSSENGNTTVKAKFSIEGLTYSKINFASDEEKNSQRLTDQICQSISKTGNSLLINDTNGNSYIGTVNLDKKQIPSYKNLEMPENGKAQPIHIIDQVDEKDQNQLKMQIVAGYIQDGVYQKLCFWNGLDQTYIQKLNNNLYLLRNLINALKINDHPWVNNLLAFLTQFRKDDPDCESIIKIHLEAYQEFSETKEEHLNTFKECMDVEDELNAEAFSLHQKTYKFKKLKINNLILNLLEKLSVETLIFAAQEVTKLTNISDDLGFVYLVALIDKLEWEDKGIPCQMRTFENNTSYRINDMISKDILMCGAAYDKFITKDLFYDLRCLRYPMIIRYDRDQNKLVDQILIYSNNIANLDEISNVSFLTGVGKAISSDGEFIFGCMTKPNEYIEQNKIKIIDCNSIGLFEEMARKGQIELQVARSVEAFVSIIKKENSVFSSLKQILIKLFELNTKMTSEQQKQFEELKKWHLIDVQKTLYDNENNLVIVGLGINPKGKYELYCFKILRTTLLNILDVKFNINPA